MEPGRQVPLFRRGTGDEPAAGGGRPEPGKGLQTAG